MDQTIHLKPLEEASTKYRNETSEYMVWGKHLDTDKTELRELVNAVMQKSKYNDALFICKTNGTKGMLVIHADDFLYEVT